MIPTQSTAADLPPLPEDVQRLNEAFPAMAVADQVRAYGRQCAAVTEQQVARLMQLLKPASLAAPQAQGVAGWKLVPVEPTRVMIDATYAVEKDMRQMVADNYRAMLSAAPSAPAEPAQEPVALILDVVRCLDEIGPPEGYEATHASALGAIRNALAAPLPQAPATDHIRALVEAVRDANAAAPPRLLTPRQEQAWAALMAGLDGPNVRGNPAVLGRGCASSSAGSEA